MKPITNLIIGITLVVLPVLAFVWALFGPGVYTFGASEESFVRVDDYVALFWIGFFGWVLAIIGTMRVVKGYKQLKGELKP